VLDQITTTAPFFPCNLELRVTIGPLRLRSEKSPRGSPNFCSSLPFCKCFPSSIRSPRLPGSSHQDRLGHRQPVHNVFLLAQSDLPVWLDPRPARLHGPDQIEAVVVAPESGSPAV